MFDDPDWIRAEAAYGRFPQYFSLFWTKNYGCFIHAGSPVGTYPFFFFFPLRFRQLWTVSPPVVLITHHGTLCDFFRSFYDL